MFFRDIKITMGMDVLRCKTPALIKKEFTMHLIAYNLVRALMLEAACLGYIAQDVLPLRPDRVEPRARKRRPKNYQLLNKPRHEFKEILHRNRYAKTLS